MRRTLLSLLFAALGLVTLAPLSSCGGEELLVADFTSNVVQRNTCRLVGDDERERCVRDEVITTLRVTLLEDEHDRVWLIGLPREGESDRRLLGTRDSQEGFLFYDQTQTENTDTGCALTTEIQLSLQVEEGADPESVGSDPCVALVGRETRKVTTSAACDDINDPPARITRINRRRWEPSARCGM